MCLGACMLRTLPAATASIALSASCWLSGTLLGVMAGNLNAADVDVREVERTYQVTTAEFGARRAKPGEGDAKPGNYAIKGTKQTNPQTVTTIELDNGLITAVIVPEWGGRLLRVTDNQTGAEYFQVREEIRVHAIQAGGVKASSLSLSTDFRWMCRLVIALSNMTMARSAWQWTCALLTTPTHGTANAMGRSPTVLSVVITVSPTAHW